MKINKYHIISDIKYREANDRQPSGLTARSSRDGLLKHPLGPGVAFTGVFWPKHRLMTALSLLLDCGPRSLPSDTLYGSGLSVTPPRHNLYE